MIIGKPEFFKVPRTDWQADWSPPLLLVSLVACAPLLLASRRRWELMREVDWRTLVFFAALFILIRSVWDSGDLQALLPEDPVLFREVTAVLTGSVLGSQLLSNVPLAALAISPMQAAGADDAALLALAAGSTIAGNLTLVGAASNIIIAQAAERRGVHLGFWTFLALGVPLTATQTAVYALAL